ncbi:MAG: NAD(P)/FAD-dependent oxidoreductase, partial [Acidimicrobiales bacterium]
ADAAPRPFWSDAGGRPDPVPALVGAARCDLAVVGAGYTGLWTALLAKEADPSSDVVVLEARQAGWAASGRNGGFCEASLTHGLANGRDRFPAEQGRLEALGLDNLQGMATTLDRYGIDCDWEASGTLDVATAPWQAAELAGAAALAREVGHDVELLDAAGVRAQVDSPTYLGGLWTRGRGALVHPVKLAWGLRAACLALGVRLHEHTPVVGLHRDGDGRRGGGRGGVRLTTPYGEVLARKAVLGTNAFPSLLRRARPYVVPVYDYVLATEPLGPERLAGLGWAGRQGISDSGNQFHYYRLTADDRVIWGGYDAVYHRGNGLRDELDQRPETFAVLARHFLATFPQLEGIRFTHTWGGAIDTCSRFCPFWGTALGGRVAYVAGYTGLGVGASRFGARVALDLVGGRPSPLTELEMVRSRPVPFPPEPFRSGVIALTRRSLARADADGGRRDLWLRSLDRLGLGYDS